MLGRSSMHDSAMSVEEATTGTADRKRALQDQSIVLKVVFGKHTVTPSRALLSTVAELKADIASQTGD